MRDLVLVFCSGLGTKGGVRRLAFVAAMLALLSGCGEMQMLDKRDFTRANDSREDIRLTNISADLTSAGLVLHRVKGSEARYAQERNLLQIKDIQVVTYGPDATTEGITQSRRGTVYLSADPAAHRNRSDIVFAGNVYYHAPLKENPSTDTLQLRTEQLVYDDLKQDFEGLSTHTVVMIPPGKRPMYMKGTQLRVPRDLSQFSMLRGAVGPVRPEDAVTSSYAQVSRELQGIANAASAAERPLIKPTPIEVYKDEGPPQRPAIPQVPPLQPSPTPVSPGVLR